MSESLLLQILNELKEIKCELQTVKQDVQVLKHEMQTVKQEQQEMKQEIETVKIAQQLIITQLKENTDLIRAIYDRQEESDAKIEALKMDVHKLHGEVVDIKIQLAFHTHKLTEGELEIFKLKRATA